MPRRIVPAFPVALRPLNLKGFRMLTTKENIMLKKLTRKLVILSVLVVAVTAVSAAPTQVRADPTCYYCYCDGGRCYCVEVACP